MPYYELAAREVSRLVDGPRGPNGGFPPAFEQQLIASYTAPYFVCAPLGQLRGMGKTVHGEANRLQCNGRFPSKYLIIELPGIMSLGYAISQRPVPLETLIRID